MSYTPQSYTIMRIVPKEWSISLSCKLTHWNKVQQNYPTIWPIRPNLSNYSKNCSFCRLILSVLVKKPPWSQTVIRSCFSLEYFLIIIFNFLSDISDKYCSGKRWKAGMFFLTFGFVYPVTSIPTRLSWMEGRQMYGISEHIFALSSKPYSHSKVLFHRSSLRRFV